VIVGVYPRQRRVVPRFTYDGRTLRTVDVPGATATGVFGVNARGDLVGAYVDAAGRTHGFLATFQ
jgi:hypothetical protein